MGVYKSKVIGNIICNKIIGELDAILANQWVEKLEEYEATTKETLPRFHDVREINAVHLNFNDLWGLSQRRVESYDLDCTTLVAFWVSTPLNYGVSRMYQALTEDTAFHVEVFYKIEEIAEFLSIDKNLIENVTY